MKTTTEIFRGPAVVVHLDGTRHITERTITQTSDVRETPLGPIDFGQVVMGPIRWVTERDGSER